MKYNQNANDNKDSNVLDKLLDDKRQFGKKLGSRIKYVKSIYETSTNQPITNNRIAEELHVSPSKITSILNGYRPPSLMQLISMANFFHVTTDYLLGLESDRFDGFEFREFQKLSGLTRRSIINLIAFQNENNSFFQRDVLFGKYNISYFTRYGIDSNDRIPHSIYNSDYSKSIADGPILLLELDSNLETKLTTSRFWRIADILSSRELTIKKTAGLNDSEMMEVKRTVKRFLKNRLPEVDSKPQTERTQSENIKTTYELRFLNSIAESIELTHMEEIANNLRLYELELKSINRVLDGLISKQKKIDKSPNKSNSKLTSKIEELKSKKYRCRERIDCYKYRLNKVIEKAVENYLNNI